NRTTAGMLPDAPPVMSGTNHGETGVVIHAPDSSGGPRDVFFNGRMPDMFRALPITDAVPQDGLGLPATESAPLASQLAESSPLASRLAESSPLAGDGIPVQN